jgi:hypothetical protein
MQNLFRRAASQGIEKAVTPGGGHDEKISQVRVRRREYAVHRRAFEAHHGLARSSRAGQFEAPLSDVDIASNKAKFPEETVEEQKRAMGRGMRGDRNHNALQMQAACFRVYEGAGVRTKEERGHIRFLRYSLRDGL